MTDIRSGIWCVKGKVQAEEIIRNGVPLDF